MSQHPEQGQQPDKENDQNANIEQKRSVEQKSAAKVGALLRDAREKSNRSIEEVAESLYFTPSRVRAIESNDFSGVPARAYALGYVRAYAKLLDMPTDELLLAFNQLTCWDDDQIDKPRARPQPSVITRERSTSGHSTKWFITGIGILVVILSGVWWKGKTHHVSESQPDIKTVTIENPLPLQPISAANQTNTESQQK